MRDPSLMLLLATRNEMENGYVLFHDDRVGALGQHDVALTGRADEQRE
jgi:hypothetical protein